MSRSHKPQEPGTIAMQGVVICGYCHRKEVDDEGWQLGTFGTKLELSGWYKDPDIGWVCYNCMVGDFGEATRLAKTT